MTADLGLLAAARCLALDVCAVEAVRALRAGGVEPILIKGPVTVRYLYPADPAAHVYCDVDLVVAPAEMTRAIELLDDGLGYRDFTADFRPADRYNFSFERPLVREGAAQDAIDLHAGFHGVADPEAFWRELTRRSTTLELGGETIQIPDDVCCALLVALHAAAPGAFDQPITDLERGLEVFPEPVWRDAAAVARSVDALPSFGIGLRRSVAGAAVAERLDIADDAPAIVRLTADRAEPLAVTLADTLAEPTVSARLRRLWQHVFPSVAFIRLRVPIARRGRLGLLAGYLLRIASRLPRLPTAVRQWRAAANPARRDPTWRRAYRLLADDPWTGLRTLWWTARASRAARRQLPAGLGAVRLPRPPRGGDERVVSAVLRRRRARCLERALVRQCWWSARGVGRDVVIAVSAPATGFHAHAWLDGDDDPAAAQLGELLRWPPRDEFDH